MEGLSLRIPEVLLFTHHLFTTNFVAALVVADPAPSPKRIFY
jgi:hypothetical protein